MLTPAQIAAFKRDGAVRPPGLGRNCNSNSNTISISQTQTQSPKPKSIYHAKDAPTSK
jgi:hypothetical protein